VVRVRRMIVRIVGRHDARDRSAHEGHPDMEHDR
jgi:hypothetical protein